MGPWERLAALAEDPNLADLPGRQARWLRAFLARHSATAYGQTHGWHPRMDPEAFRQATPPTDGDMLRPWFDRIAAGEENLLFPGSAAGFARTSGSSGGAKTLPYTPEGLSDFRRVLGPWIGRTVAAHGLGDGRAYTVTSPALWEGPVLPDGAYLGPVAADALGELSILPQAISSIRDLAPWRRATLRALAEAEDLVFLSLWSPTLFLGFLEELATSDPAVEQGLSDPAQARLRAFRQSADTADLWPRLRLVSAWEDGSSRPYAQSLRQRLPHAAFEGKGLLATEGVVTVPFPGGAPMLAPEGGLFEFLEEGGEARWAHELKAGRSYQVLLTTASGLARYALGDTVRCEGHAGELPRLRFLGRHGLTSDLVGEKLSETFVAHCLDPLPGFRMLVPNPEPSPGYLLVVEAPVDDAKAVEVEASLAANPHYAHARRMGQLAPLRVLVRPQARARYEAWRLAQGVRPGDLKIPALGAFPEEAPCASR